MHATTSDFGYLSQFEIWRLRVGDLRVCRYRLAGSPTRTQLPPLMFGDDKWQ